MTERLYHNVSVLGRILAGLVLDGRNSFEHHAAQIIAALDGAGYSIVSNSSLHDLMRCYGGARERTMEAIDDAFGEKQSR